MLDQFVTADMYANLNGAGGGVLANPNVVSELSKALSTAAGANIAGNVDGSALIPQSLETTLKVATYKMKELKLWQMLGKRPAFNTAEEFNQLLSYGMDENGFISEGALPNEDSSDYQRQVGLVKFMGTVRSITHPMTLVKTTVGNIIDQEDTNGTMHLLRLLEQNLIYGDSRLNPLAFDGLKRIIASQAPEMVIDLRGRPITERVLEELDQRIAYKFGEIDVLIMSTKAKADTSKLFLGTDQKRILLPQGGTSTNLGMTVDEYHGNNSTFKLEGHKFIRERVAPKTVIPQAMNGRVAARPQNVVAAGAAAPVGQATRLEAGTYRYVVSAINDVAEGLPSVVTADVVVAAGDLVNITWDQVAGARSYRIYRNPEGSNAMYLLDEVRDSGAATTTYADRGFYIPGTSIALGLFTDPDQGMSFKQLCPLMKLPLAQVNTSMRWAILLYGMLQVYQPKKQVLLINVGSEGLPADAEFPADLELEAFVRGA